MIHHTPSTLDRWAWAAAMLLAACVSAGAQPEPATPDARPVARTPWGDPDITGVWTFVIDESANPAAAVDIVHGPPLACLQIPGQQSVPVELLKWPGSLVHGTADGEVPYLPWAKAKRAERLRKLTSPPSEEFIATSGRCLLSGMPATMLRLNPEVHQFKDHILILWEYPQMHRVIWTDGRPAPSSEIKLWQGFSVGRWEGDALAVTTSNQNGFPWLDGTGNFVSANAKVTETIRAPNATSIVYKVVVEDPATYSQPWWMEWRFNVLKPGASPAAAASGKAVLNAFNVPNTRIAMSNREILEVACVEGERHHTLDRFQKPARGD